MAQVPRFHRRNPSVRPTVRQGEMLKQLSSVRSERLGEFTTFLCCAWVYIDLLFTHCAGLGRCQIDDHLVALNTDLGRCQIGDHLVDLNADLGHCQVVDDLVDLNADYPFDVSSDLPNIKIFQVKLLLKNTTFLCITHALFPCSGSGRPELQHSSAYTCQFMCT